MITLEKDTVDPQTDQELRAFTMKHVEIYNKHDATALAELFTEDAVMVAPEGLILGRQAIEKKYAGDFHQSHPTNYIVKVDQGNAIGNNAWTVAEWLSIFPTPDIPFPLT